MDHDNNAGRPNGRARFGTRQLRDGRVEVFVVVSTADAERIERTVDKTSQNLIDQRDEVMPRQEWVEHLGGWDHAGETYDHHYAVSVIADSITHYRRNHDTTEPSSTETEHTDPNLN